MENNYNTNLFTFGEGNSRPERVINPMQFIPDSLINTNFEGIEEEHNIKPVEETLEDIHSKYENFRYNHPQISFIEWLKDNNYQILKR